MDLSHYSCIQAAINATTKRTSSERFVIYVKKGLYRENIEVGINVNNIIMLVAGALEGATPPTTQQLQVKCLLFFFSGNLCYGSVSIYLKNYIPNT